MTKPQIKAFEKFLDWAIEGLSNRCCNDTPEEILAMFTTDELTKMDKDQHDWNGDPEEYEDRGYSSLEADWILFGHLARMAVKELGENKQ